MALDTQTYARPGLQAKHTNRPHRFRWGSVSFSFLLVGLWVLASARHPHGGPVWCVSGDLVVCGWEMVGEVGAFRVGAYPYAYATDGCGAGELYPFGAGAVWVE